MQELVRVSLENEMDLILVHKRTMKLAELVGLSLSAQTTFATAVSEISRQTIEGVKNGHLILGVHKEDGDNYIVAGIKRAQTTDGSLGEGFELAKKLVNKYNVTKKGTDILIELFYFFQAPFRMTIQKLDEWRSMFRNEPAVSPYEELKRKNEQLQELSARISGSEAQYKAVTNALPMIVFTLDAAGEITYANEWLEKTTGVSVADLNRTNWRQVIFEEDFFLFKILKDEVLKGAAFTRKIQLRIKQKDGEYLWHSFALSPVTNDQEVLINWIGYLVDIHAEKIVDETLKDNLELKQARRQLESNQRMLEEYVQDLNRSNMELQQYAFVASHDLQQPVRKVLYYADVLASEYAGNLNPEVSDRLKKIKISAERMRNLIEDLLTFSQIQKDKVNFQNVELGSVIAGVQQDLEMMILDKNVSIDTSQLAGEVMGDERMLRQLFQNIISNSIKYSKKNVAPAIKISTSGENQSVKISLSDNGIGFDEKYIPQMFRLFQRLHGQSDIEGNGLGLAICKKIVDLHGGTIQAKGKEGSGATFIVTLPVKKTMAYDKA